MNVLFRAVRPEPEHLGQVSLGGEAVGALLDRPVVDFSDDVGGHPRFDGDVVVVPLCAVVGNLAVKGQKTGDEGDVRIHCSR
ncbi:hypothetical protein C453_01225 [Haloferax elongans ATCC BAA-1513]|uniref:Uncharacterized protein n=1 Tax=Haloferax elongans ATCC BAA-1513 TaxID=1230453 RepID=M0HYR5_HALEO|nr:hypothetical protein [Haloferax elongans]ELZ88842.1 hypothetical protein C453_01225 [Haloferax elongans ATCC BAA-1513]